MRNCNDENKYKESRVEAYEVITVAILFVGIGLAIGKYDYDKGSSG